MSYWRIFCAAVLVAFGLNVIADTPKGNAPASSPLVWEPMNQVYTAKLGEISAHFTFHVKNVSGSDVIIDDVKPSCGCTVAQLPHKPWRLVPGETNHMEVLVDLRNKWGKLYKTLNVLSTTSPATLGIVIDIPPGQTNTTSPMGDRLWGQQLAAMDHQAVFKKDCVHCHLEPAFGKYGQNLYTAACGICHEAKQRATMVPDLHALNTPIDADYWRHWVTYGKPGSLMPGFAATLGGPLEDDQIKSLVDYLKTAFPRPLKSDTASSQQGK